MRFFPRGAFAAKSEIPVQAPVAPIYSIQHFQQMLQFQYFQQGVMQPQQQLHFKSPLISMMPLPSVTAYQPTANQFAQMQRMALQGQQLNLKHTKHMLEQYIRLIDTALGQVEELLKAGPKKAAKSRRRAVSRNRRMSPKQYGA